MYTTTFSSPVGLLTLGSDGEYITGLWIEGQKYFGGGLTASMTPKEVTPFKLAKQWLDDYFSGAKPSPAELPLRPAGSPFRQEVFNILCAIPYGELLTYGEIAAMIAAKRNKSTMSSQAVGGAVGHNPIAIIIPCHRVVGAKGNLTGFASGIKTKIYLLRQEGVDTSAFYTPTRGTAL